MSELIARERDLMEKHRQTQMELNSLRHEFASVSAENKRLTIECQKYRFLGDFFYTNSIKYNCMGSAVLRRYIVHTNLSNITHTRLQLVDIPYLQKSKDVDSIMLQSASTNFQQKIQSYAQRLGLDMSR